MLSLANYPYSRQEIIDALHGKYGNRQIRFRYDLLDKNDNKIKELDSVIDGEVSMASLSSIKRTARFKIKDKGDINWLTDRIQPFMELKMPEKIVDADTPPTFSRSSVAYTNDGKQVANEQPRYEAGKFGRGIMIEEGTTNLVSNPSFENGLWAETWETEGTRGTASTVVGRNGNGSAMRLTVLQEDTTYGKISSRNISISSTETVTISYYARANRDGVAINYSYLMSYTAGNYSLGGFRPSLTTDWKKYTVTLTNIPTASDYGLMLALDSRTTTVDTNDWVEIDDVQIEKKSYATSFINGTRAAETLTIPTAGVLNKDEGTIELWINPNRVQNYNNFFKMENISTGRFLLFFNSVGQVFWDYGVWNSGLATSSGTAKAGQWLHVAMRWSASKGTRELFVNGVLIGSKSFTPPSGLPSTVSVVNNYGAIIDDIRISSRARTDEEIQAGYQSNAPLPVDKDTTYKLYFDGNLTAKTFLQSQWIEFPLGIFLLSSPTRKDSNQNVYRDVEAYDGLLILRDDKFVSRYTVPAGTNYRQAVIDILASAGITKHNIEQTDKVLPVDMEFAPGTEKLEAINALLQAINYTPIHVDVYGYFTSMTYRSPSIRAAEYTYKDDELSIIYPGMEEELDLFNVPNKWVVVCSNAEQSLMSSYTNSNPNSPTSTVNRGRTIVDYREVTDIADQQSLDAYVQRIAFEASQVYGKLTFETAIMPHHDYMDVLQIEYSSLGISGKYVETGWTMTLSAGARMKHEVRKVVSI
jgi:hypothetical protein